MTPHVSQVYLHSLLAFCLQLANVYSWSWSIPLATTEVPRESKSRLVTLAPHMSTAERDPLRYLVVQDRCTSKPSAALNGLSRGNQLTEPCHHAQIRYANGTKDILKRFFAGEAQEDVNIIAIDGAMFSRAYGQKK